MPNKDDEDYIYMETNHGEGVCMSMTVCPVFISSLFLLLLCT